ncbi:deoxyribose-phosphate aldolase [Auritidibacter ignavus]|uniref:deoxyribose-phosphate aldolase n=1 Tax=Auritidibacter ignavus TaxID=678932 RepID=UPI00244C1BF6|nr:deoxyribose-phosphate aldolase [Auritidibacter ignavus]WGH91813.1 deoxyribose-phosphate aldolase [Auritidibacter ignavus]
MTVIESPTAALTTEQIDTLSTAELAGLIDHTLLTATATAEHIAALCDQATAHRTASVCVNPFWVPTAVAQLEDSPVAVCSVVGFPLGATTTWAKATEAQQAVAAGATEIDMVINLGALHAGDDDTVIADIAQVVEATKSINDSALVKVIVEIGALTGPEGNLSTNLLTRACQAVEEAHADFVKTSTGFGYGPATRQAVTVMRQAVSDRLGVKASGGIKTRQSALQMLHAGANRLGCSATLAILERN